jgi:excisionase family DNA binding protein
MSHQLLTVKDLSALLSMHPNTIYRWKEQGKIPCVDINGQVRFEKAEIEKFIEKNKRKHADFSELFPRLDISLEKYDKLMLKGESALSKKLKRWNYGFGAVYIRKTKQGKERWYIDYQDEDGRRVQGVVKKAQKREDALIELQSKVAECFAREHSIKAKAEKIKFPKFVEMYLENYAKVNKISWKDDFYRLQKCISFFGNVYLHEVTALDIEKFKCVKIGEGLNKTTVNHYLKILKRLFNIAIEWEYAKENPVKRIKFYSEKDSLTERILTEKEEVRLLEVASGHLRPILMVALNTGMRRGEILNLTWNRIDLEKRLIRVVNTKSGRNRIIPVNDVLFEALSGMEKGSDYLFPNPGTGKPYRTVRRSFETACRREKIKGLRFHDLRHTFASRLVERGVDIVRVKELLGHSSVKITERYTHSNQEERKRAVELLCKGSQKTPKRVENLLHHCDMEKEKNESMSVSSLFSVN